MLRNESSHCFGPIITLNVQIILNKVLLVGTRTKAYIGQPVVTNAAVHAVVEEQVLFFLAAGENPTCVLTV